MKSLLLTILIFLPSCSYFTTEKTDISPTPINISDSNLKPLLDEINRLKGSLSSQDEIIRLQYTVYDNSARNSDLHRLGNLFVFKGWYEQAESVYKKLLIKEGEKINALNGLGILEFRKNNMTQSLEYFYSALKEAPENLDTLNNMGIWHSKNGNLQSAKEFLEKIISIKPEHAEANANLGSIYHGAEEYDKAIGYLRRSLEINGKPLGPRILLAESYEKSNQLKKSEKEYRYILAMDSANIPAVEGLSRLLKNKET
jgi:tetratricopeptide (TPR) repeat protein